MTKEEYDNLLQSDYWKGYSYSLIKERNFTCEDCGRSFPNMRNMLQVHHLVYRDANPWSYKPEELIVLCKECHQKRHGIYSETETTPKEEITTEKVDAQVYTNTYTEEMSKRYAYNNSPRKKSNWFKLIVIVYAIMYLFYLVLKDDSKEQNMQETSTSVETSVSEIVASEEQIKETLPVAKQKSVTPKQETKQEKSNHEMEKPLDEQNRSIAIESKIQHDLKISQKENSDSKTKGNKRSTLEILEERTHASVVEQAKEAGVSAEGSTLEILERINHASVVEQAKEAGVSTEGSTLEILDRINHASVVKQAKEMGVSTDGSTLDILERISRKMMEELLE